MKTHKNKLIGLGLLLGMLAFNACSSDENLTVDPNILGLGGETWAKTEIDEYIDREYVTPYNIEVKYKWDRYEVAHNYRFAPMDEEKVVPLLTAIKRIWIEPYEKAGGDEFIKKMSFRKFILIGSQKYESSGGGALGEAEGGRKVTLYRLNWFSTVTDAALLKAILKTVHHEYGHILDQTTNLPSEWEDITASGYVASWSQTGETEELSIKLGFVSRYSRANPGEDFAEMLSLIVTNGRAWFDARVAQAQHYYNTEALAYNPATALRKKESMVEQYMLNTWGVPLYDMPDGRKGLESYVQQAIADVSSGN